MTNRWSLLRGLAHGTWLFLATSLLAACGGGGGGGGGSDLNVSLSPKILTGSIQQGSQGQFYISADVTGRASGTVYVLIVDPQQVFNTNVSIDQDDGHFLALLTTVDRLPVGHVTGTFDVNVCGDPACNQRYDGETLSYDFEVLPTIPTITSGPVIPADAGGAGFSLQVRGSNFLPPATVLINGMPRTTAYFGRDSLYVDLLASDLAVAGSYPLTVSNSGGAYPSSPVTLLVQPAVPQVSSLSPATTRTGSPGFELVVQGEHFILGSTVMWNGSARTTRYGSSTVLAADIPASDLVVGGAQSVTVLNPIGGTSTATPFQVVNGAPVLLSLAPSLAVAGGAAFELVANGSAFVAGTTLTWNSSPRPTTLISPTQVRAQIPASDIATAGAASIAIVTPTPGGGTSSSLSLSIVNPPPTLTSLAPAQASAGDTALFLYVTGTDFTTASVVTWNGVARATSYVSSTVLVTIVTADDLARSGTASVRVFTPEPGGGLSPAAVFTIRHPLPSLRSVTSSSSVAGCPAFSVMAVGSNFEPETQLLWNGSPRATTIIDATRLSATITAADVAAAGSASITVQNPAPGGGASASTAFTIRSSGDPITSATSFRLNPAHTGYATTECPVFVPAAPTWTIPLAGTPRSVLIAEGKIFAIVRSAGPVEGDSLYAFDASTRAALWGPVPIQGGFTSAAPTYDAGRLFVMGFTGLAQAFDAATGTSLWSTLVATPDRRSFDASPTAANGLLYLNAGGSGASVYGLLQSTGTVLWERLVDPYASSPAADANGVYVSGTCDVLKFEPLLGVPVWSFNAGCQGGANSTPSIVDGRIYAAGMFTPVRILDAATGALLSSYQADVPPAYGPGFGYFLVNRQLRRLDLADLSVNWTFDGDLTLTSSPLLVNDWVVIRSAIGQLYALDAVTGAPLWTQNVDGNGADIAIGDSLMVVPSGTSLLGYAISSPRTP